MRNHHYTPRHCWLAVSIAIVTGLASHPSATAQPVASTLCRLGGFWQFTHANGIFAQAKIDQSGARFSGRVTAAPATGTLYDGRISGRNLRFRVKWSNGRTIAYRGYVRPDGNVEGSCYDVAAPGPRQLWVLQQRVDCRATS